MDVCLFGGRGTFQPITCAHTGYKKMLCDCTDTKVVAITKDE